ncbi:hypothetical protein GGI07_002791 [Coemansia sp. Benny D115]|nr:hypothetical protein GGI07_002791 [Coemansia sp. Benny D115]
MDHLLTTNVRTSAYAHHTQHIRSQISNLIDQYVQQGEYGKASELLLVAVESGNFGVSKIWQQLVCTFRNQQSGGSLDMFLDSVANAVKGDIRRDVFLERIFNVILEGDLRQADSAALTFVEDEGKSSAVAYGYRGMLIACLRELDVGRVQEECVFHVFEHCEGIEFNLTMEDERAEISKFKLKDAEKYLKEALYRDPGADMFRAFYAQVLVARGHIDMARDNLQKYYQGHPDLHILRMIIALDPRSLLDQTDHLLEYLEKDPFASSEKYFSPFIHKHLAAIDEATEVPEDLANRLLQIVLNRIELGEYTEPYQWRFFEHILRMYGEKNMWHLIEKAMVHRMEWWPAVYFDDSCVLYGRLDQEDVAVRQKCCDMLQALEYEDDDEQEGSRPDVDSDDMDVSEAESSDESNGMDVSEAESNIENGDEDSKTDDEKSDSNDEESEGGDEESEGGDEESESGDESDSEGGGEESGSGDEESGSNNEQNESNDEKVTTQAQH